MLRSRLNQLCVHAWAVVHAECTAEDLGSLFRAKSHTVRLTARRGGTIVSRVRLLAGLFSILAALSIVFDIWVYSSEVWRQLMPTRVLMTAVFVGIFVVVRRVHSLRDAYLVLFSLFAMSIAFVGYMHFHFAGIGFPALPYFPFVMIAVLSIFPLTLVEGAVLAVPILVAHVVFGLAVPAGHEGPAFVASVGALLVVSAVSLLAALSQLSFIIVMVRDGMYDVLTGCYSRRCGEELLELEFASAKRSHGRLAVARVALDHFQKVNMRFGYTLGDAVLKKVAEILHDSIRSGDALVRWTGDQFLLILPHTVTAQATEALQRLLSSGLGLMPDGVPLTASIGIAERTQDVTEDWWQLVDLAETRVRLARDRGGNCTVAE